MRAHKGTGGVNVFEQIVVHHAERMTEASSVSKTQIYGAKVQTLSGLHLSRL